MNRSITSVISSSAILIASVGSPSVSCPGVTVYGGPTYDAAAQTFSAQNIVYPYYGGVTNGAATVNQVQTSGGSSVGQIALRFDPNGTTPLGDLGAPGYTLAYGSNASGTFVGTAAKVVGGVGKGGYAVRWNGTAATELAALGSSSAGYATALAFSINATGTAVGYSADYLTGFSGVSRAVRWDSGSTVATPLARIANNNSEESQAIAVNASGTAVGYCMKLVNSQYRSRATRWAAGGTAVTELETLGAATDGTANAQAQVVSDDGTTAGYSDKYVNGVYAEGLVPTRWDANSIVATELGDLGVFASGNTTLTNAKGTRVVGVDGHDTLVGYTEKYIGTTDLGRRAVRWASNTTAATELGSLGTNAAGSTSTVAFGTNASGLIAGAAELYVDNNDAGSRAVVWGTDGVAVDLNTLIDPANGWTLTEAHGVSDTSWVYGIGFYDPDGTGPAAAYSRAFLVQVPEPTTFAVGGLIAIPLLRRRRR